MSKAIEVKDKEQAQFDKDLAVKMQSGSTLEKEKAYIQMYSRYKNGIMHFISRFMNLRNEDVEDFAQEVFVKVYEKIHLYKADSSNFSTWIYNMTTNHLIDAKRKAKFEIISIESMSESKSGDSEKDDYREFKYQFVDKHTDTFRELVLAERSVAVHLAASRIKSELGKEIVRLKYFEQLTNDEIAVQLNMNVNTVKIADLRAKKEMKDMLTRAGVDFDYGAVCKKTKTGFKHNTDDEMEALLLTDIEIVPLIEDELVED